MEPDFSLLYIISTILQAESGFSHDGARFQLTIIIIIMPAFRLDKFKAGRTKCIIVNL